jgi:hypothetical protein
MFFINRFFRSSIHQFSFVFLIAFFSPKWCLGNISSIALIEQSCLECHDEDVQKGNLRLDELYSLKKQPKNIHTWLKIYDQVESGEMPPKKKAFTKEEREQFLNILGKELTAFDQSKKKEMGRVVYRRLSSTEYEYIIRDLLHLPHLNVKQYLPGDSSYHGIENVAATQQIAYNQVAQYLEAAEMSLQAAVNLRPKPQSKIKRIPGTKLGASRKAFNKAYKLVEQKLILAKEPELSQGPWGLFTSPDEPGYYKIRFKAHSAQLSNTVLSADNKEMPLSELLPGQTQQSVTLGISLGRYLETFDLSPETSTYECTVWLHGDERLSLHCNDLPLRVTKFNTAKKNLIWDAVALDWFEIEGPIVSQWPQKGHAEMFGDLPIKKWSKKMNTQPPRELSLGTGEDRKPQRITHIIDSKQPEKDSQKLLHSFMEKAYRRPVAVKEVLEMQNLVTSALKKNICFHDAMLIAYKAILTSPDFLYLQENPGKLNDFQLATRLSLYLWRSIPDQRLTELAKSQQLSKPKALNNEIKRMLKDSKAKRFIDDFSNQWLDLDSIYATTPDKTLYPEYHEDQLLIESLVAETKAYMREVVRQNLPISTIIDSNFTFLNERLADHYGLPKLKGSQLQKVKLPKDSIRGGLITQGSMMKITANGFTTSPIKRGIWLTERILGTPPPPPPPDAGSIEPDIRGAKTIREILEKHREVESCASCHRQIDPPGFALESLDIMGAHRQQYRSIDKGKKTTIHKGVFRYDVKLGQKVDSSGQFLNRSFRNINSFKSILKEDLRKVAKNIVERLITQATGAAPNFSDRKVIEQLLDQTEEDGYRMRSLIAKIIQTPLFLEK